MYLLSSWIRRIIEIIISKNFKIEKSFLPSISEQILEYFKDINPVEKIKQYFLQSDIFKVNQKKDINLDQIAISILKKQEMICELFKILCNVQSSNQLLKTDLRNSRSLHEHQKTNKKKNLTSTKLNNFLSLYNSNDSRVEEKKKAKSPFIGIKLDEISKESKMKLIHEIPKIEDNKLKIQPLNIVVKEAESKKTSASQVLLIDHKLK